MKKIRIIVQIVFFFLFISCTNDIKFYGDTSPDNIHFLPISEPVTRGTALTSAFGISDMGVFGYYTQTNSWNAVKTTATPNRINNIKWTQNNGAWGPTSSCPWKSDTPDTDNFTFFAYSPFQSGTNGISVTSTTGVPVLTYTVPTDVSSQPDLMVATTKDVRSTINTVPLNFKHALACISFKAYGTGEKITAITLRGVSRTGTLGLDNTNNIDWRTLSDREYIEYTPSLNNPAGVNTTSTPTSIITNDGSLMMIPQQLDETSKVVVTVDGKEYEYTLTNQNITQWKAGDNITYTIKTLPATSPVVFNGDYTTVGSSNCYILNLQPTTAMTYRIPIKRVNEFWGNPAYADQTYYGGNVIQSGDPWKVGILWKSSSSLTIYNIAITKSTGTGPDDYFEITVPAGKTVQGNFVVAITKGTTAATMNSTGMLNTPTVLWSWHFWVTDYNPYATPVIITKNDKNVSWAWSVPNGKLYKYDHYYPHYISNTANNSTNGIAQPWNGLYASKKMMDRNIGAIDSISTSGQLYYQFGRKDPFSSSKVSPTSGTSLAFPVMYQANYEDYLNSGIYISPQMTYHPYMFDTTTYNITWKAGTIWGDVNVPTGSGKKSIFDPSPYGFKIPENGTWQQLDTPNVAYLSINPSISLGTGVAYYSSCRLSSIKYNTAIPACGYLGYTDGALTSNGIQAYLWSGSSHTTTNKGYCLNVYTTEIITSAFAPSSGLYRLNAAPIRCVEE